LDEKFFHWCLVCDKNWISNCRQDEQRLIVLAVNLTAAIHNNKCLRLAYALKSTEKRTSVAAWHGRKRDERKGSWDAWIPLRGDCAETAQRRHLNLASQRHTISPMPCQALTRPLTRRNRAGGLGSSTIALTYWDCLIILYLGRSQPPWTRELSLHFCNSMPDKENFLVKTLSLRRYEPLSTSENIVR